MKLEDVDFDEANRWLNLAFFEALSEHGVGVHVTRAGFEERGKVVQRMCGPCDGERAAPIDWRNNADGIEHMCNDIRLFVKAHAAQGAKSALVSEPPRLAVSAEYGARSAVWIAYLSFDAARER